VYVCLYVCMHVCKCVCEREIWPIWSILWRCVSTNQNRESLQSLVSFMPVYDDDADLLISNAQQRVKDRLVPSPDLPLLSLIVHSSLSISLTSSFSTWNPCKLHQIKYKSASAVGKKKIVKSTSWYLQGTSFVTEL